MIYLKCTECAMEQFEKKGFLKLHIEKSVSDMVMKAGASGVCLTPTTKKGAIIKKLFIDSLSAPNEDEQRFCFYDRAIFEAYKAEQQRKRLEKKSKSKDGWGE